MSLLVINDAMVLIHLAKITVLETCCGHFGEMMIPPRVFEETVTAGKKQRHADATLIEALVDQGKIRVKPVAEKALLEKAQAFNIDGGEAEAVALYWQEKAGLLATDDDNVRGKKELLKLRLIGTPAILLSLFNDKKIGAEKTKEAVRKLRKIGWFGGEVLDKVLREVEKA